MISIKINGKEEQIKSNNLSDLLDEKNIIRESLIIEHNHKIIKKENWQEIRLEPGDNLELLSFVGGG